MMAMRLTVILLLLARASLAQGPEVGTLDLTKPIPPPPSSEERPGTGGGGGVAISGRSTPQWPLDVRLASVDRQDYALGDRLIYEVIVTNVGTTALDVPWSADPALAPQRMEDRQRRVASFGLFIDHGGARLLLQAANGAYGSDDVSGSMKRLNPGESVRVRAAGEFRVLTPGPRIPATVRLRAQVNMHDGLIETHPTLISTNAIEVHVEAAKH